MPDERLDSIRQGVGVPPESEVGKEAEREKNARNATMPLIGGGMGGTSDAETAPDEARMAREIREAEDRMRRDAAVTTCPRCRHPARTAPAVCTQCGASVPADGGDRPPPFSVPKVALYGILVALLAVLLALALTYANEAGRLGN